MTESAGRKPGMMDEPGRTAPGPLARLVGRLGAIFSDNGDISLRKSLEGVIEQHDTAEGLSAEERSMLLNILEFGKLRVDDVMVPRADIVAVDHTTSIGELVAIFKAAGHSRLPVYRETLDDPIGMVHIKDMLSWIATVGTGRGKARRSPKVATSPKPGNGVDLSRADLSTPLSEARIRRDVLFVPPSMLAVDLLVKMQTSRIHMAIVVDEYGGTDGLASIEDLVEVIVGDIEDEHDIDGAPMIVENEFGYDADARLPIEDLDKILGLELVPADREEDVDTLGGLVFSMVGRVPVRGELIRHEAGVEFEVLEGDPRRLKKLRIHLSPRGAATPALPVRRREPEPDAAPQEPAPGNETTSAQ
jgi:CBS domain containing-hemolysin-like protein